MNLQDNTTVREEAQKAFADITRMKERLDRMNQELAERTDYESEGYLEIFSAGTSKAAAIRDLARQLGAGRVVVFGDNRNDIAMMQAADFSVAVDNAFTEVKSVASEVIGPNTADSVARWIEQDLAINSKL